MLLTIEHVIYLHIMSSFSVFFFVVECCKNLARYVVIRSVLIEGLFVINRRISDNKYQTKPSNKEEAIDVKEHFL